MIFTKAVEIAKDVYWIGQYLENDPFQCLPYLIKNKDESILIDPGSMIELDSVIKKIKSVVNLSDIKYIILHHQDPDLCASVPELERLINRDDLLIVTHSRMTVLIKHYMVRSNYYEIDKNDLKLVTKNGLELKFLTTPYCHSPGAFVTYDKKRKILFSGDIFGGLEESWEFYADNNYFDKAKAFHSTYMPSKDIFNYTLRKIEKLELDLIAPQHGSIIKKEYIPKLIEDMKNLNCGLYIEDKYNKELNDIIKELETKEKELEDYKNHLEEKIREKTLYLEELNSELEIERNRLNRFNKYLSELNSIDISYLANTAIKHILDITEAQVGIFYIKNDDNHLKDLAKYSIDENLFSSSMFNGTANGIVLKALNEKDIIYLNSLEDYIAPSIDTGFFKVKLKKIIAIPLISSNETLGVVLIGSISKHIDQKYLKGYLNSLSQSLHNAINYVKIQKQSIELKDINMQLEESNRLKSEFLANVSHELRTPLNSIIGFSNILLKNKKGNLLEKQLDQLEKINRNGIHLLSLINNILDLSKIEAGKMELDLREVEVITLINSTIELLLPQANNKKLTFTNALNASKFFITTDEQKLQQIIINLVGNGLKFVESGSGEVNVKVFEENGNLIIAVVDNGIGIEEDKKEKIFEAFRQSDGSTTRKYGGTGLGLTISKRLANMLGGDIKLQSQIGVGSTFSIVLPLKKDIINHESLNHFKKELNHYGPISSVLIIDDVKDVRELLKEYLKEENYAVYVAKDGFEGIEKAKKFKPSVITLDIMMDGIDGWEVLKKLKADIATRNIPVIVLSNITDRKKSYLLGAIDTLTKPISKEDLLNVLYKHFQHHKIKNALIVDDEEDARELIYEYIKDDIEVIKSANDGREALSLINNGFIPDIIYLDLMMPNIDGFEFIKKISSNSSLKNIKIVVVTAKDLTNKDLELLNEKNVNILKKENDLEKNIKSSLKGIRDTDE